MPGQITKRKVDALASAERDRFLWDRSLPGFGVRCRPSGKKYYVLKYRAGRRQRWFTIGQHGVLTPDAARKVAVGVLAAVEKGVDPSSQKDTARDAMTVKELCDDYLKAAEHGELRTRSGRPKKSSTLATDRGRILRHIKPLLGRKIAAEVTQADIRRFQAAVASGKTAADVKTKPRGRAIVEGGEGTASRTLGLLGAIFTYAVSIGVRPDNPVRGVPRPKDGRRDRRLSAEEYGRLGVALDAAERDGTNSLAIAAIRFLALTGCRKGEALSLQWSHVDEERRCLRLPDTKTGESIRPLAKAVLAALKDLPRLKNPHVFPAASGEGHYEGLPRVFASLAAKAELEGVTLHTLRHSFASVANELGFTEPTIAAMLGHSVGTITGRYIHHLDQTLLAAAERVASFVSNALGREPIATIVQLPGATARR